MYEHYTCEYIIENKFTYSKFKFTYRSYVLVGTQNRPTQLESVNDNLHHPACYEIRFYM